MDLEAVEKELITKALHKFDGNQTRAAAYLNLSRKTFLYRLDKFGIIGVPRLGAGAVREAVDEST
ncbi:MAG: helix-turn-helix domain-containing protein [Candidatus Solibacter sp.]|nr:helix-turn-helix domain-containing protein [Candidatus Solibacter sp.]